MGRGFIDTGYVAAKAPATQGADTNVLAQCIDAACALMEKESQRRFLTGTYTAWHSGDRAITDNVSGCNRALLYLADPATGWAILPVTAVSSIVENGTTLAVKRLQVDTSFGTGEIAVVNDSYGTVLRAYGNGSDGFTPKSWISGRGNIRVVCTAGYFSDGTSPAIPEDLAEIARDLSWLFFREGTRSGMDEMIAQGMDVRFSRMLGPYLQKLRERYRFPLNPHTWEG